MAVEIAVASRKTGRPCRSCRIGIHYGTGYCEKCQGTASTKRWSQHHKGRTTDQRGYGSQWRIIREQVLIRDKNLCQPCLRNNVATPAKQVDHIIAKALGGSDAESNLEAICIECHKVKTANEKHKRKVDLSTI